MEGGTGRAKEARTERKGLGIGAYRDSYVQDDRLSPRSEKCGRARRSRQVLGFKYASEILGKINRGQYQFFFFNISRIFLSAALSILYLFDPGRYAWVCGPCMLRNNAISKSITSQSRVFWLGRSCQ